MKGKWQLIAMQYSLGNSDKKTKLLGLFKTNTFFFSSILVVHFLESTDAEPKDAETHIT